MLLLALTGSDQKHLMELDMNQFHGILFHFITPFQAIFNHQNWLFPRPLNECSLLIISHVQVDGCRG